MTAVPQIEKKDTRSGFGQGLLLAGRANDSVVALCADLKGSLKMDAFATEFPDRYIECGIAEANMIGVAAGLALDGHVPWPGLLRPLPPDVCMTRYASRWPILTPMSRFAPRMRV